MAVTIGDNVRELRTAHGWTQADFAMKLIAAGLTRFDRYAVNQSSVSGLENDRLGEPGEAVLHTLCRVLRMPRRMLLAGTDVADETLDRRALAELSGTLMDAAAKAEMLGVRSARDVVT